VPYYIVARSSSRQPGQSSAANQFTLMADGTGYTTREEAQRALDTRRPAATDRELAIVEASSPFEAAIRAQTPDGAMPALAVEVVGSWQEMTDALNVRRRVFIDEQGVSEEEEIDEYDLPKAWGRTVVHVLGRLGGPMPMPLATGRLLLDYPEGEHAHIGRVAVLREFRGNGYGRAVMEALQDEARRRGRPGITLAAQMHAIPFYEGLGYIARGEVFLDAGIEHRWMDLRL
jgi:predicted GNAT family N-acyltransferase